ncbi:MAG: hypothetical protein EBW14_16025 [Oxalobacteraceae bacterium]|nr:hypothetical protein [Oxalobacteraceae bacterium]
MKKQSVVILASFVFAAAACGGSGNSDGPGDSAEVAEQYGGCSEDGATAQSPEGLPLKCLMNSAGELMWDVWAGGQISGEAKENATGSLNAIFGGECG